MWADIEKQSLTPNFWVLNSSFAYSTLFSFTKAQSKQGLNIPVRSRPIALQLAYHFQKLA